MIKTSDATLGELEEWLRLNNLTITVHFKPSRYEVRLYSASSGNKIVSVLGPDVARAILSARRAYDER